MMEEVGIKGTEYGRKSMAGYRKYKLFVSPLPEENDSAACTLFPVSVRF